MNRHMHPAHTIKNKKNIICCGRYSNEANAKDISIKTANISLKVLAKGMAEFSQLRFKAIIIFKIITNEMKNAIVLKKQETIDVYII